MGAFYQTIPWCWALSDPEYSDLPQRGNGERLFTCYTKLSLCSTKGFTVGGDRGRRSLEIQASPVNLRLDFRHQDSGGGVSGGVSGLRQWGCYGGTFSWGVGL